jgi:hypothetical protein
MLGTMPRNKKPEPDSIPDRHKYPVISFRPGDDLRAILQQLAHEERRSLSQMLVILAEEALAVRKRWPPPQEGRKDS